MKKIYLDYAATTPVDSAVVKAMEPYFCQKFGNPSSAHRFGQEAQGAIEEAREKVAKAIGASAEEIIFTSSGTEANNQALFGIAASQTEKGRHIIISSIEHSSVLNSAKQLEKEGFSITYLPVDKNGQVSPADVEEAITSKTILISVMHANNEIGTIQPISAIGEIANKFGVLFHCDSVQTTGHISVDVKKMQVDLLSMSAHKFYGPKGIGALFIRKGVFPRPLLWGGNQEHHFRASTHNVPGIVGMAEALGLCMKKMVEETSAQTALRDYIIAEIPRRIEGAHINGHLKERLPNNVSVSFENISGESLLMSLDMEGIAVSMGSACHAGALEPSHVLKAMGVDDKLALGTIRITLGRWTTKTEIDIFLDILTQSIKQLRF